MATITLTSKNLAQIVELGNTISQLASTAGIDNRVANTFTVTDGSPMVVTSVDSIGNTRTTNVG